MGFFRIFADWFMFILGFLMIVSNSGDALGYLLAFVGGVLTYLGMTRIIQREIEGFDGTELGC